MLHKTLEANGGLPSGSNVVFANTGKEMPQTLDFVQACSDQWGVEITWVELGKVERGEMYAKGRHKGKHRRIYRTSIVNYETASRNGEPFMRLLLDRKMPPNVVSRFCTSELKVRRMMAVHHEATTHFIGIRADEQRRAARMHNQTDERRLSWCPMYLDGTTKEDVAAFWRAQPFDLQLANDNGTTPLGNCDLCFLKGKRKRVSIVRQHPELVDWWIEAERRTAEVAGNPVWFQKDLSYAELKLIATDGQGDLLDAGPDFACFCGD